MIDERNSVIDRIKISKNGRITIPKKYREALKLSKGTTLNIYKDGEYIVIKKENTCKLTDILNYTKSLVNQIEE